MEELHEKLCKKYPWYSRWHERPNHIFYHWLFFVLLAGFAAGFLILNLSPYLNSPDLQANLAALRAQPPNGKVIGFAGDHILMKFKDGIAENGIVSVLTRHNLQTKSEIKQLGVKIISLGAQGNAEETVRRLNAEEKDSVEFAEVDAKLEPSFIPNDPDYPNEWHEPKISAPLAWDSANGSGVVVAVADTGVDYAHPDLAANIVPGWNLVDNNSDTSDVYGHGTEVAGAAAAVGNNLNQIAGVAYNAKIMPIRISDTNGNAYFSTIANGITYAADHGAKVVNVSYAAGGSRTVQSAAKYMQSRGGITVMSEGNSGGASGIRNSQYIVSVSATDNSDLLTNWSTYGADVDVSAPGQAILTTTRGGGTGYYSGTSFSAPITAGILALIWSANPNLTADQAQNVLFNSATDLGAPGWDEFYGWGRVDAGAAVNMALQTSPSTSGGPGKK